jgi:regulator of replication initiation timing
MSDTPISDSTPHNIAELGMLCRRLERKLAATRKYLSEVTEKAKKLEVENDALRADLLLWREAKP